MGLARDATDSSGSNPRTERSWAMDGVAGWREAETDSVTMENTVNDMNEYTEFDGDVITHDDAGNMDSDDRFVYRWDAFGRLREVWEKPEPPATEPTELVATYTYDAHSAWSLLEGAGRRIHRKVEDGHLPSPYTADELLYAYDGWQVIEEFDGSFDPLHEYTYASYIDEPVTLTIVGETDTVYTYHLEANYSTGVLSNSSGFPVEYVTYDPHGLPRFVDSSNDERDTQVPANLALFQGRTLDPETGLYYYRHRYYDPTRGRFVARDPLICLTLAPYRLAGLDPTGLYVYTFTGTWTPTTQKDFTDAVERVTSKIRILILVVDLELEYWTQEYNPKGCLEADVASKLRLLLAGLDRLREILEEMLEGLESQTPLNIDSGSIPFSFFEKLFTANWRTASGKWTGDTLHLSTDPGKDWRLKSNDELDSLLFHEFSHESGTEDSNGRGLGSWNNAHYLESVAAGGLAVLEPYWNTPGRSRRSGIAEHTAIAEHTIQHGDLEPEYSTSTIPGAKW